MKASVNRLGLRVVDASPSEDVRAGSAEQAEDIDLLYGIEAIAACLRLRPRQVKHRAEAGQIPTFKIGGTVCSRRSTLRRWLNELEKGARS